MTPLVTPATRSPMRQLPKDLLIVIAECLPGADALVLAACSKLLKLVALRDASWVDRLINELGYTESGVARWKAACGPKRTIVHAYFDAVALTAERPSVVVSDAGWSVDRPWVREVCVRLELENRWPMPIWTFITAGAPGEAARWAARNEMSRYENGEMWCSTFESRRGDQLQVLNIPRADGMVLFNPQELQEAGKDELVGLLEKGWVQVLPYGEDDDGRLRAAPAVTAVPLPPQRGKIILSNIVLRLDLQTWLAAQASGELVIEVMQAIDVECWSSRSDGKSHEEEDDELEDDEEDSLVWPLEQAVHECALPPSTHHPHTSQTYLASRATSAGRGTNQECSSSGRTTSCRPSLASATGICHRLWNPSRTCAFRGGPCTPRPRRSPGRNLTAPSTCRCTLSCFRGAHHHGG